MSDGVHDNLDAYSLGKAPADAGLPQYKEWKEVPQKDIGKRTKRREEIERRTAGNERGWTQSERRDREHRQKGNAGESKKREREV